MAKEQIKYELFTSAAQTGRLPQRAKASNSTTGKTIQLSVTVDGATQSFEMSPDQTVLEAALAHDIDVPFSCRAGVCSTCRCKVTEGEVAMDTNHALEDYEVARGYALSCQARPMGDRVSVDYDT